MINNQKMIKSIPIEEALNLPEYQEFKEVILFIEEKKKRGEILFPNKYLACRKLDSRNMLMQMRRENESIGFNDAIIEIFKTLPKQMTVEMYPPLMKHLAEAWEKMSNTVVDKSEKATSSRELVHH
jgi:hypothetical protein